MKDITYIVHIYESINLNYFILYIYIYICIHKKINIYIYFFKIRIYDLQPIMEKATIIK